MRILSLLACGLMCLTLGCGVEILAPPAKGNQGVFRDLSMHLTLNEYDVWNYTQRDANGVPTIQFNHSIRIRVGGGLTSYRELLQVFVDGKEVSEVGSAGLPQQYSYLHWVQKPTKNHQYVIEFRYRNASFFAKVDMTEGHQLIQVK